MKSSKLVSDTTPADHVNRKRIGTVLPMGMSLVFHGLAFLQFTLGKTDYNLPDDWTMDFYVLLFLSCLLAVILYASRNFRMRVASVIARILVFLILGAPFGGFMDIRYMLLFSLLLDLSTQFRYPINGILSVVAILSSLVFAFPINVFSSPRSAPDFSYIFSFFLVGVFFMVLLLVLRNISDRNDEALKRISELSEAVSRLIGASCEYLEYAARVEKESVKQERKRIIQDLHDVVGQSFTNIYAIMDASLKHPVDTPEESEELHTWVKDQAQKGLNETRAVLYQLRSITMRELSGIEAIQHLVKTFSLSTKVDVHVEWGNLPWKLQPALDDVIYRVVQEALINAYRHGNATAIQVYFWISEDSLQLDIEDNGTAGAVVNKGIGQESMERRVESLGGKVTFTGTVHGYRVHAVFPRSLVEDYETNTNPDRR